MATTFKTPGVYIQEISTLPASIAAVETAIPAFIGYTEKASKDGESLFDVATRITSMLEYEEIFGGPFDESNNITVTVDDTTDPTTGVVSRSISATMGTPSDFKMYYSVKMFYENGGGPCYILSMGTNDQDATGAVAAVVPQDLKDGINLLEKVDEPTLLVFPDEDDLGAAAYGGVYDAALAHCNKLQDRFVIMDVKNDNLDPSADAVLFRDSIGSDYLKYGAVYYPKLKTTLPFGYSEDNLTITHTDDSATGGSGSQEGSSLTAIKAADPAMYRELIAKLAELTVDMHPSGAMAGIYAKVDSDRGVWKAPANTSVKAVSGLSSKVTNEDQEGLNIDATSGKSINAIRSFTGKGILVWGARTLAGNDNEWRYVPVRRLFIFIEESVKKATEFVVFEPNDANTWLRVKTMIENFLSGLWREGALAGAKPEDAFFVNVGLGVTMTAQDILEGRMNVEIGLAAVRPAEFIILKFSHKLQES